MSLYITGAELIAFTNVTSLAAASAVKLEANIIARAKLIIDKYCFRDFTDLDTGSDEYAEIQLAQKLLSERLWIKDNEDAKSARIVIGKGGSEKKGSDWSYSLGEAEEILTDEIKKILDPYRDWDSEEAKRERPATGRVMLKGDQYYEQEVNSRNQNTI